jgi:hypothetical protein
MGRRGFGGGFPAKRIRKQLGDAISHVFTEEVEKLLSNDERLWDRHPRHSCLLA